MSEEMTGKSLLSVDEIAAAAFAIASEPDFANMARRLLDRIQEWAAPSVIACLSKDQDTELGWRMVPELIHGTVTPAFERSIVRLIEEAAPKSLDNPVLVRPQDEMPGSQVKVRDNWIVPCRDRDIVGYLFLRGIGHPYPANLGQAVALASQALWSRLQASRSGDVEKRPSPAIQEEFTRLNDLVGNLQGISESLMIKLRDERERIRAEGDRQQVARRERDAAAETEAEQLRERVEQLSERVSTLEKERASLEEEKAVSLRESESLKARVEELSKRSEGVAAEGAPPETEDLRREVERLTEQVGALEKQRASLEEEKTASLRENESLKARVEELAKRPEGVAAEGAPPEAEDLRREVERLTEQVSVLERQRSETEKIEKQLASEKARAVDAQATAEARLEEREKELEETRRQVAIAEEKTADADKVRLAAEAERDRAKAETHRLWGSIESLQKQLSAEKGQFDASRASLSRERDLLKTALDTANERLSGAESRAIQLEERWKAAMESFQATAEALRRTPFVPPMLRVAFAGAENALAEHDPSFSPSTTPKPTHLLFLDREPHKLERLANELETAGIEVLIAHYPEEVGFFLKTPESRRMTGVVCDVMAFRPDQDLMDILRSWRQDLTNLALLVSFQAESAMETEKAQRLPVAIVAGYLPRPLERQAVQDAVGMIVRRQFGRAAETPVPRPGSTPERQR